MEHLRKLKVFQKPLSIILALVIVVTCFVIPSTVIAGDSDMAYWTGETKAPSKGSGSLADPFLIETPEEFAYMLLVAHGGDNWENGSVYRLMNNIYLNDISKINWATGKVKDGYTPNVWNPTYFSGVIQGNGHMVYGLYIERNPEQYTEAFGGGTGVGLISENWANKWVSIENLGMDCVYINSQNASGVFMGCAGIGSNQPRVMFDRCYIGNNVTVKGFSAGGFIGGANGAGFRGTIMNSASLATAFYDYDSTGKRRYRAGAMLGDVWSTEDEIIENCYSLTKLFGNGQPGHLDQVEGYVKNCYSYESNGGLVGKRTYANMQGLDVLTNESKMPGLGNAFTPTESFPIPAAICKVLSSEEGNENLLPAVSVWSGEKIAPSKGSGSLADPYLIETAEEFAYMLLVAHGGDGYDKNATYKLMNDIYLNDVNKINWNTGKPVEGYKPNVWEPTFFSGIILGNGHTVYGMYIERNPEEYKEAWGNLKGAALIAENWSNKWTTIENMGMDCVYVNSPNVSGVFIAGPNNANIGTTQINISGCYIGSNVTVKGFAAGGFIGGGSGLSAAIQIKNCANLSANYHDNGRNVAGGIIGDVWSPTDDKIDNCYSVNKLHGNNPPTGSLTNNYSASQSNSGSITRITVANMKGLDATTAPEKMPNLGTGFGSTKEFPLPVAFFGTVVKDEGEKGQVWNGSTLPPVNGEGTAENPFEIATAEQLAYIIKSGGGANYKLTADIYLNDIEKIDWATGVVAEGYDANTWYSNIFFSGTIDGNGHMVYGMYVNDDTEKTWSFAGYGLIPRVGNKATLKNLGIDKAYINAPNSVGGFFGSNQTGVATAEKCFVGADVTLSGYETGAFLGLDTGEFHFDNCYSHANIVKGIAGDPACDIGLLGEFYTYPAGDKSIINSSVTNCYNTNCGGSTKGAPGLAYSVYTVTSAGFGTTLSSAQMQGNIFGTNRMALTDAFIATETYPVLKVFAEDFNPVWNGLAHAFKKGDGKSAETAFEISDAGHLAYVIAIAGGGAYYKLTSDICLNEIEKIDWSTGTIKEGVDNYSKMNTWFAGQNAGGTVYDSAYGKNIQFKGHIDGNGHTIYGILNANDGVSTSGGLIPGAIDTTVLNLKISNSYIAAGRFGGAIGGYYSGTLENVVVDDSVYVYGYESKDHESSAVGGLLGYTNNAYLKNCAFTGHISHSKDVNHKYSLVGTSWATTVKAENCFGTGLLPFAVSCPAKHFNTQNEAVEYYKNLYGATNVYTDATLKSNTVSYTYGDSKTKGTYDAFAFIKLDNANMKGENALSNMSALSSEIWKTTDGYPTLKRFAVAIGDVDGDGMGSTKFDAQTVRNAILDDRNLASTDISGNGKTDVCDLVKAHIAKPIYMDKEVKYYFVPWNGIESYLVHYTIGDSASQFASQQLQKSAIAKGDNIDVRGGFSYFDEQLVLVVDENMGPAEFKTEIVGANIIISAGSENALNCAVGAFGKLYTDDYMPVVCGVSDYDESITLSSGNTYSLVWNDEFYGNSLDRNKWVNSTGNTKMSGFEDLKLLDTEDSVFVKDGKLTLRAMEYTDPNNDKIKWAVPASVHSQGKMEYRFGYAEIYAKVPFKLGVWPSFWAQSTATLGGRKCFEYGVEVDIFEIFGNVNTVVPNIHKWYHEYNYNENHNVTTNTEKGHTQLSKKDVYKFSSYANLSNEFHLYGFEWTPTVMSMYVDGYLYETIDIVNSYDKYDNMDGFHDPLFLIFNNHLFTPESSWVPEISAGDKNYIEGLEDQNLPADYEIDWLRIYQNASVEGSQVYSAVK